jgi:hypothetical protein
VPEGKEREKEADSELLLYRVLTSAPVELQLGTDWARAGARRAQRSSTERARGAGLLKAVLPCIGWPVFEQV